MELAPLIDEIVGTARQLAEQNNNRLVVETQENLGALTVDGGICKTPRPRGGRSGQVQRATVGRVPAADRWPQSASTGCAGSPAVCSLPVTARL